MIFYFIDNSPRYKCGVETALLVGAGASAAGGLANGFISSSSSKNIADKQINAQKQENQINRDWQTEQAEIARNFNQSERVAAQDWQKAMIDFQNEYNSPVNQAARYRDAGLNPNVVMSGQSQSISATPSGSPQSSSPTVGSVQGLSPVSQQPLDLQLPQMANAVASMLTGVANAKKAGVETSWLEKSMDLNLRNLSADASLKDITSKGIQLDNALKSMKFPSDIKRAIADAQKAAYDAVISFETIGKVKNETELISTQKRLNDALSKLHDTNTQLVGLDVATYWQRLNSALKLQSAQANSANASAVASRATADLSQAEKLLKEQQTGTARVDRIVAEKTIWDKIDASYQSLLKSHALSDTQVEEYHKARSSASWSDAEHAIGILKAAASAGTDVVKFY